MHGNDAIVLQQEMEHLDVMLLSQHYSKEWITPKGEIKSFARTIWHQCQALTKLQCDGLMKLRWEERVNH